jgi:hypothetical protein
MQAIAAFTIVEELDLGDRGYFRARVTLSNGGLFDGMAIAVSIRFCYWIKKLLNAQIPDFLCD